MTGLTLACLFCITAPSFIYGQAGTAPAPQPANPAAQQAWAILQARPEADAILFKDTSAGTLYARIMKCTAESLTVEKAAAAGVAAKTFPLAGVAEVHLPLTRTEQTILERHDAVAVPLQRAIWELRKPLLGLPGSNAGEWALALARSLRVVDTKASREEAQSLATLVADKDADTARQRWAADLQELLDFEKLLATGKQDEILKAANRALERGDEANVDLLLQAVPALAKHEFASLKTIEKENPRWMDDDEIRPERDRHYQLAQDMFLHAFLFHGDHFAEAAEGLWNAARVYSYTSQPEQAFACLKDIVFLYPDTPHVAEAKKLLKDAKQDLAPTKAMTAEAKPVEKAATNEAPKPKPAEKKYKLFDE